MQYYKEQTNKQHLENIKQLKKLELVKNEYISNIPQLEKLRDKLSVNVMVPIPSNSNPLAFMEGTIVHTNELLVFLGSKYLAKMTTKDAIEYCQRKYNSINQQQEDILKEQKLLVERISFINSLNCGENEIVEHYEEDEEKLWRDRHAENVKKMKKQEAVERHKIDNLSPEQFFSRLEELEQEELETNAL